MIKHFLVQDFKDSFVGWIIVAAVLIMGSIGIQVGYTFLIQILPQICFFFGFLSSLRLIGTTVRSQHVLSRLYVLSLPISRKKMFNVLLLRCFVFYIPLLAIASFIVVNKPHSGMPQGFKHNFDVFNPINAFGLFLLPLIGFQIYMILILCWQEEILRSVAKLERFLGWIKMFGFLLLTGALLMVGIILFLFYSFHSKNNAAVFLKLVFVFIGLFLEFSYVLLNYFLARKKWIGE